VSDEQNIELLGDWETIEGRIAISAARLHKLMKLKAPPVILEHERRLLVRRVHDLAPYMEGYEALLPDFVKKQPKPKMT